MFIFEMKQRVRKGIYGLRFARDAREATVLLRSRMDEFSERASINLRRREKLVNPKSGYEGDYHRPEDPSPNPFAIIEDEFEEAKENLSVIGTGIGRIAERTYCYFDDLLGDALPEFDRAMAEINTQDIRTDYNPLDYLDREVLTDSSRIVVKARLFLDKEPPIFVTNSDLFNVTLTSSESNVAFYAGGTNVIVFKESEYEKLKQRDPDMVAVLTHETLHYLCRAFREHEVPLWFNEGATEYFAQRAVRKKGLEPQTYYYANYVRSIYYLGKLVGEDTLLEAYLTGDMTEIRAELNKLGGFGTFDKVMSARSYEENISVLRSLCEKKGLDTASFDKELREWGKKFKKV